MGEYKDITEKVESYRGTERRLSVADKIGKVSTGKSAVLVYSSKNGVFRTFWGKMGKMPF
jgi:hypothetical protein